MKIESKITNQKEVEITISITMKNSEWAIFHQQVANQYPSWRLKDEIGYVLFELNKTISLTKDN